MQEYSVEADKLSCLLHVFSFLHPNIAIKVGTAPLAGNGLTALRREDSIRITKTVKQRTVPGHNDCKLRKIVD
jgi:hypothetical protein